MTARPRTFQATIASPYTTNSIESLNYQLRKVTKARGHFPGDDAEVTSSRSLRG